MGKKILIVDDASIMRLMLKNLFANNGFEVVGEAVDGNDAIKKYSECKPDLVTMDITMPELDGIAAVKGIMAADPNAKIIMCSAMGQVDKVKAAILSGAKGFLVKPLQPDKVLATVNKVLGT